jgi:hypothetical protein
VTSSDLSDAPLAPIQEAKLESAFVTALPSIRFLLCNVFKVSLLPIAVRLVFSNLRSGSVNLSRKGLGASTQTSGVNRQKMFRVKSGLPSFF